ncbi:DUF4240 domain-containing protein [Planomonospora sp. ID67723]|uniref:DUF4240 domain-containing protein n=1 Tax=Planomonospora sp. ID67723 TaxID=2738134 RepID=UPI0018C420A5|nr:DUF4240 domain-containing protein [Planomonospora sp. ID67723]MBG0830762.1 DUF4240 domain-containing protein [Planomonospora sp. ID67723]
MDVDTWWDIIERARKAAGGRAGDRNPPDDPMVEILTGLLLELEPAEIIAFERIHIRLQDSAYRWPLWNAAQLIEGGCGDDGFMDFRTGLMLLGRTTFTRAVADPDSLAGLPVVVRMSRTGDAWIGCEDASYATRWAYERIQGESDSFDDAVTAVVAVMDRPGKPVGENWDVNDQHETRRRLPRLSALFLDPAG